MLCTLTYTLTHHLLRAARDAREARAASTQPPWEEATRRGNSTSDRPSKPGICDTGEDPPRSTRPRATREVGRPPAYQYHDLTAQYRGSPRDELKMQRQVSIALRESDRTLKPVSIPCNQIHERVDYPMLPAQGTRTYLSQKAAANHCRRSGHNISIQMLRLGGNFEPQDSLSRLPVDHSRLHNLQCNPSRDPEFEPHDAHVLDYNHRYTQQFHPSLLGRNCKRKFIPYVDSVAYLFKSDSDSDSE